MFFSGICSLFSQVVQQVPVKRTGDDTVRENLVNPFTEIAKVFTGILLQNKYENPDFSTDFVLKYGSVFNIS